jgi:hypothetical protein
MNDVVITAALRTAGVGQNPARQALTRARRSFPVENR